MENSRSVTLETTKTPDHQAATSSNSRLALSLRRLLIHARWTLARKLRQQPSVFMPLLGHWGRTARGDFRGFARDTEVVVDAYPRSANTFATYAFLYAQSRPVRVCHHHHAPACLIAAAKRNLPALTIVREPFAAIRSFAIYRWAGHPHLVTPRECVSCAIKDYVAFYQPLLPIRNRLFVARFTSVTSDYGDVLRAFYDRYDAKFETFEHTPENVAQVYRMCDAYFLNSQQSLDQLNPLQAARPRSGIQDTIDEFNQVMREFADTVMWRNTLRLFDDLDGKANI